MPKVLSVLCKGNWQRYVLAMLLMVMTMAFLNTKTPASAWLWGHLHETESSALATWLSAIATVFLLWGLWFTKLSIEESKKAELFRLMFDRFNAPNVRFSRATFAKTYLERYYKGGLDRFVRNNVPPRHGFELIGFLNQIGYLVQEKRLNSDDVVLAYSTHVQLLAWKWRDLLDDGCREEHYRPFLTLYDTVNAASDRLRTLVTESDLGWVPAQRAFLESEAALDPLAKSEDDPSLSADA